MIRKLILAGMMALDIAPAVAQTPATQIGGIAWNPLWYQGSPPPCIARSLTNITMAAWHAAQAMVRANGGQQVVGVGKLTYSISPDGKTKTCEGNILVMEPGGITIQPGQLVVSPPLTDAGRDYSRVTIEWLREDPDAPPPSDQDVITFGVKPH